MQEFNFDQSAHVYRAMPGLNKSSIEKLLDCPLAYKLGLEQKDEPTPAMAFGTLVHSMILEPETVDSLYHVMQASATTKAGKAEKAKFAEQGITCISRADFDKAQAAGISNTQLYKQAGNSIVVNCLEAIFNGIEWSDNG